MKKLTNKSDTKDAINLIDERKQKMGIKKKKKKNKK